LGSNFFSGPRYVVNPCCLLSDELRLNIQYEIWMQVSGLNVIYLLMSNVTKHESNQESDKQSEKGSPFSKLRAPESQWYVVCMCASCAYKMGSLHMRMSACIGRETRLLHIILLLYPHCRIFLEDHEHGRRKFWSVFKSWNQAFRNVRPESRTLKESPIRNGAAK